MKINPFHQNPVNPYKRQQAKLDQTEQNRQKVSDKVEISNTAKELQSNNRIQEERQSRVDKLKVQVENGTYKSDPSQTALDLLKYYRKS
ncbi:flagellar biosynthesis anti-sigma factor FlgM [Jeotgalibacillus aurantiacus]|uniref:flagellar biosynthesis anti-sigma factor FlgM n=1 Tax=Jeotgalibacillus aurantiacus TaxID=2763266 RepID=UPI001D0A0CA6|nr:flagellar biosynthesis anti-sigma factor FlgM [Jeotgalibacillus aurantiacus]